MITTAAEYAKTSILIVEDEPIVAMLIEEAFVDAGYEVLLALDGAKATERLWTEREKIAGVVTDIRMPGTVDGWEVARRARDLKPGLPVIYLTGDSADKWKAYGVTGSVVFAKPQPPMEVVAAMAALLASVST